MSLSPTVAAQGLVSPTSAERIPVVLEALRKISSLHGLTESEYLWIATHGMERHFPSGATLFHEGQPANEMSILLGGEVHVRREKGSPAALFVGRAGQISGLMPFSRMKGYGGTGYAVGDVWGLEFDQALFKPMLEAIPSMGQRCVGLLLDRVREVTRIEQQTEKLMALGKLAGNLAHELNNPASAAQRAASGLLEELRVYGQRKYELGSLCLAPEPLAAVRLWQQRIRDAAPGGDEDQANFATREDSLARWLAGKGLSNAWQISPELTELGVSAEDLDELWLELAGPEMDQAADSLPDPLPAQPAASLSSASLSVVLSQFASSVRAERMTGAMIAATARIFDLIRAIKDYSYMDQAPIQEVDIPQGLETTLIMLQSRLQHVQVERRYEPGLPHISAYASELNQVWMALLENALDAIDDRGKITLSVQLSGHLLLIEVWDDGPGIPPELQDRIFEPFFTTKAPGTGLGLGLDTVQRIIRKHRGYVRVHSEPGQTCFQVRLPVEQLQAY